MTQEEKARAYDEALKRAKAAIDIAADKDLVGGVVRTILPELTESEDEDERIRKFLIDLVSTMNWRVNWPEDKVKEEKAKCIAYLEKQKEQKPVKVGENAYFDPNTDMWFIKKEQKPSELNEEFVERLMDCMCAAQQYRTGTISWDVVKGWAEELNELKMSAEWSEEDEKHLIWLCRIIHSRVVNKELSLAEESKLGKWIDKWINHGPQPVQKWDEFDEDCLKRAIWYIENPAPSVVKDTNLALWIKSLPERFNLSPKPEWSEEDKEMIERLIRHTQKEFDELCNDRYGHQEIISDLKESCRERMRWLEKLKSLRPSWKPSEEQMKALEAATVRYQSTGLESLFEELKKRM